MKSRESTFEQYSNPEKCFLTAIEENETSFLKYCQS